MYGIHWDIWPAIWDVPVSQTGVYPKNDNWVGQKCKPLDYGVRVQYQVSPIISDKDKWCPAYQNGDVYSTLKNNVRNMDEHGVFPFWCSADLASDWKPSQKTLISIFIILQ